MLYVKLVLDLILVFFSGPFCKPLRDFSILIKDYYYYSLYHSGKDFYFPSTFFHEVCKGCHLASW